MSTALLDRETIERTLAEAQDTPILIALSGGGDSVALLHLLVEELGATRLRACVVDHGLRAESAEEAAQAAAFAHAADVAAEIVTLRWDKPRARSQSEARTRRYQALCAEARRVGARVIALGHTRDDQAETIVMRGSAGSGWRGMAGMAAFTSAPLWPEGRGLWIARPLLRVRRESLRDALRMRGATWIEDASNANTRFTRVRVRADLRDLDAEGVMGIAAHAEGLAPRVAALDADARDLIARAARFEDDKIVLDREHWTGERETRQRALAVLIAAVSGEDHEGAPRGLATLEANLRRPDFTGATLGGARLKPIRDGVRLERDRGAVLGRADGKAALAPLPLAPGQDVVWDGRLALTASAPGWAVTHDDTAAPVLVNAGQCLPLAEAQAAGIVEFQWLLEAHVAHLLAQYRL